MKLVTSCRNSETSEELKTDSRISWLGFIGCGSSCWRRPMSRYMPILRGRFMRCSRRRREPGDGTRAIPDGLFLDCPEQSRKLVLSGEPYATGLTLVAARQEAACEQLARVCQGLERLGRHAKSQGVAFYAVNPFLKLIANHDL